jgi:hypothetical protein
MVDVEPAVKFALAQVGKPYVFGSAGPNTFDCSGLTMRAFQAVGINMPHSTYTQVGFGVAVSKPELQRGDLLFPDPGHVQIYLGNNMVVEAPHTGANVRVVPVWGFFAARRLGTASGTDTIVTVPAFNPLNPLDDLKAVKASLAALLSIVDGLKDTAKWLSDPANWFRIFLVIAGGLSLLVVAWIMVREQPAVAQINEVANNVV